MSGYRLHLNVRCRVRGVVTFPPRPRTRRVIITVEYRDPYTVAEFEAAIAPMLAA